MICSALTTELDQVFRYKTKHRRHLAKLLRRAEREGRGIADLLIPPDREMMVRWERLAQVSEILNRIPRSRVEAALMPAIRAKESRRGLVSLFADGILPLSREQASLLEYHLRILRTAARGEHPMRHHREALMVEIPRFVAIMTEEGALYRRFRRDVMALPVSPLAVHRIDMDEQFPTFELRARATDGEEVKGFAYRKLPFEATPAQVEQFQKTNEIYHRLLWDAGVATPMYSFRTLPAGGGRLKVFFKEERIDQDILASRLASVLPEGSCIILLRMILREIGKVASLNLRQRNLTLGIDAQLHRWAVPEVNPARPRLTGAEKIIHVDAQLSLVRVKGKELVDPDLLLGYLSPKTRFLASKFILPTVLNRHFTPRPLILELVANFLHHGRSSMLPQFLREVNANIHDVFRGYSLAPLTEGDVRRAATLEWTFKSTLQAAMRVERMLM